MSRGPYKNSRVYNRSPDERISQWVLKNLYHFDEIEMASICFLNNTEPVRYFD